MSERTRGLWLTKGDEQLKLREQYHLCRQQLFIWIPNNICFANHRICLHECQLHQWWCFALFGSRQNNEERKQKCWQRRVKAHDETTTAAAAAANDAAAVTNEKLDTTWIWIESKRIYAMSEYVNVWLWSSLWPHTYALSLSFHFATDCLQSLT